MKTFRYEINGLRAIAVFAVLLFHAKVSAVSGGFAGVDIFFVISGFLMTTIVLGGLDRCDFSLLEFWAARARRILPALAGLVAVLAVAGWFLIDPLTYGDLGTEVAASLTFVSNIEFWRESGYFDQAAEAKWLLHTWSLSVEWQFYLVYPIVLVVARRFLGPRPTIALLWLGFAASLALSIVVTAWRPAIAFYMLPTRAWEMIAGGLVMVHGAEAARLSATGRRIVEVAGLALIVLSLLIISAATPWPSFWAFVPVAGTAAVIVSDRKSASLLNLRAVQALGSRSYSVYLWHWPVIVAFRYYAWDGRPWAVPVEIGLGLALGALSYRLVERPSQAWLSRASLRHVGFAAIPALAALLLWSAVDVRTLGFVGRSQQPALMADFGAARSDWFFPEDACARGGRDKTIHVCRLNGGQDTLVVGDSHANQWFVRAFDRGNAVTFVTRDGCPPLPRISINPGPDCPDFYSLALKMARDGHYKRVVFAAFWQSYVKPSAFEAGLCVDQSGTCVSPGTRPQLIETVFKDFAGDLKGLSSGTEIVLVLPDLEPPGDLPVLLAKRLFFGRDASDLEERPVASVRAETEQVRLALQGVAREVGAKTIDPLEAECGPVACRFVDAENRPLFRDSNHLRSSIVKARFDLLDAVLGTPPGGDDSLVATSSLGLKPSEP